MTYTSPQNLKHLAVCILEPMGGLAAREMSNVYRDLEKEYLVGNKGDKHIIRMNRQPIHVLPEDDFKTVLDLAQNTFNRANAIEKTVLDRAALPQSPYTMRINLVICSDLDDAVKYAQESENGMEDVKRVIVTTGSLDATLKAFGLNKEAFTAEMVKQKMKADLLVVPENSSVPANLPADVVAYRQARDFFHTRNEGGSTVDNIVSAINGYYLG